ncbi:IS110 family transposase [Nocardia nepalensis]|uniref:IS110 family transposase n=1 Tax=Nocardia nepalensis TaxID=3375448 RepID=UPI003B6745DF
MDAFGSADQARLRRDLGLLRPGDEIAVDLRTLTNRRLDVVFDRTRQINRLRAQLWRSSPLWNGCVGVRYPVPIVSGRVYAQVRNGVQCAATAPRQAGTCRTRRHQRDTKGPLTWTGRRQLDTRAHRRGHS